MKKKRVITLVAVLIFAMLAMKFPVWRYGEVLTYGDYYGDSMAKEILYSGSWADRRAVSGVMEELEEVFSSVGRRREELQQSYGELAGYAWDCDTYPEIVRETHKLKLWSAACEGDDGYLWIRYDREGLDENGEVVSGGWDVLVRLTIHKDANGEWQVVELLEHP